MSVLNRLSLLFLFIFLFSSICFSEECSIPPFYTAGVKPNVLFVMDNSGSMNEFAYHEIAGERCWGMTAWTGYDEGKKYYGLFNPDKCYKYDNTHHYFYEVGNVVDDPNTDIIERAACLASNCTQRCFSGNWLNWWTMRRFDIAKKVLTGGRLANDTNEYVLIGSPHERDYRRIYNDYASTDTPTDGNIVPSNKNVYYTPFHRAIYSYFFTADPDPRNGQFVPLFSIVTARFDQETDFTGETCVLAYIGQSPDGDDYLADDAVYENLGETGKNYPSYYVAVKVGEVGVDSPPTGIVQNVADKVRLGYMQFNLGPGPGEGYTQGAIWSMWDIDGNGVADVVWRYGDGGRIVNYVGDNSTMTSPQGDTILTIVHNINEQLNEMWTPLAEVLNEAMRYFKQESPCYLPGEGGVDYQVNDTWDPYYYAELSGKPWCAKSYIIFVSDGEANMENGADDCGSVNENFPGDGGGYMDDIAFRMHTQDLRSDLQGNQNVTLYTIFTFEDSTTARNYLMRAARAGGFTDLDGDGLPYCDENCDFVWGTNFYAGSCDDGPEACDPGCQEWDTDCNGVPDTYYEAQDGYMLEEQLLEIFADITAEAGSASAVATVTQEVYGQDVVVRGAFKYDPSKDIIWRGSLDVYWPDEYGVYDFQDCSSIDNQEGCESKENEGCSWVACTDIDTELECEQISDCSWNTSQNTCVGSGGKCEGSRIGLQPLCIDMTYSNKSCWDAGELMPDASERNIFTSIDGTEVDISVTNYNIIGSYLENETTGGIDFNNDGSLDSVDTKALINWLRGDTTYDGTAARDRSSWILGDIVYSAPVVVGEPSVASVAKELAEESCENFTACESYSTEAACDSHSTYCSWDSDNNKCEVNWNSNEVNKCFYTYVYTNRYRKKMVYVGANDGMLHAFVTGVWWEDPEPLVDGDGDHITDESHWIYNPNEPNDKCDGETCTGREQVGKELWAYVPSNLLSELKELARPTYGTVNGCAHRTLVDLSPNAWDVYIRVDTDNDGSLEDETPQWRTVLLGGERGGGDVYFAIDVTDPDNPRVLWEFSTLRNMVMVHSTGTNKYKAVLPYQDITTYEQMKIFPTSWSVPYVGRLEIPNDRCFLAQPQITSPLAVSSSLQPPVCFGNNSLSDWFVFIGGGSRVFDPTTIPVTVSCSGLTEDECNASPCCAWENNSCSEVTGCDPKEPLFKPYLMVLDMETGVNIFQYAWPLIQGLLPDKWPDKIVSTHKIPYAMGNPVVLDIANDGEVGRDGNVDHLYIGDLNGFFYGFKFNLASKGIKIDVRQTKPVDCSDGAVCTNYYRSNHEPITVTPSVSLDPDNKLRVYFGTGKFDEVEGDYNDKTDGASMAFYSLKDSVSVPAINPTCTIVPDGNIFSVGCDPSDGFIVSTPDGSFGIDLAFHCDSTTYNTDCYWSIGSDPGEPDCCESNCCDNIDTQDACSSPCAWDSINGCYGNCWTCIFDFTIDGERVIDQALVAGGLVFVTTFVPNDDPCAAGGDAYLYALDYLCGKLSKDPFINADFNNVYYYDNAGNWQQGHLPENTKTPVIRYNLGTGMPSRPVLDSSGKYLLVQTSNARIHRIPVDLPQDKFFKKGWKEQD